jgi:hypothetical protein
MFNLSVLVTDAFMKAVADNADWSLVFGGRTFRTVKARGLWERIMRATYDVPSPASSSSTASTAQQPALLRDHSGYQPVW